MMKSTLEDSNLTGRDKFRVTAFLPIVDKLCSALQQLLTAYSTLGERFGFLSDIPNKINDELKEGAQKLVSAYPNDLETGLENEIVQFSHFIKSLSQESCMAYGVTGIAEPLMGNELHNYIHNYS